LIEKYNELAREASSNGDKILSENYLQHADHFTRVLNERESFKREKFVENKTREDENVLEQTLGISDEISKNNLAEDINSDTEVKKVQNLK
tara:strand:- start:143 stop:415 length:273 start_codon:yes stop_codon:yes gene_type:complete